MKQRDILLEKQARLSELAAQADAAVDLVTRTISGLETVNQEIDSAVEEIDSYTAQLRQTRDKLSRNRQHNAAIIANFTTLLAADAGGCEAPAAARKDGEIDEEEVTS